jgi:hypothetical protein
MGFGDNEPPALRVDPFAATLRHPSGFKLLILTFVSWDVLKISVGHAGTEQHIQIDATGKSTEFEFKPTRSGTAYSFAAQGCARAIDGSTNFCSPMSKQLFVTAATNTNRLSQFLRLSGVPIASLRSAIGGPLDSLRNLMGLKN